MRQTEELLKMIDTDIKSVLSEERYNHSIGVMKKAEELAIKYKIDVDKAKLTGLAHDIAKEMNNEEMLKYVKENNIEIDEVEKINIGLLHGKIGADICKRRYNFTQDMQDAIKYHTTGKIGMDNLAKIVMIADKTEEGRKYEDLEEAKRLADEGLDIAILYIIDVSINKTIERKKLIHPDSIYLRNSIIVLSEKLNNINS